MYSFIIYKAYLLSLWYFKTLSIIDFKLKKIEFNKIKIYFSPIIIKHKKARIIIGKNVTLNSDKKYYHLSMHSKVKLVADKENSIIKIGDNTRINGCCIHAFKKIEIGNNCLIAANTQIIDSNGHLLSMENPENRINTQDNGKPIFIGDNVWIGANSIILGGTTIGNGTVISAGSVVKGNIPPNCIYGGNPAQLIKSY